MNKIISRMLVLGLLISFVQAQQPPRDIDKDAHKATKDVKSGAKNQNKAQDKDNKATGDHDFEAMQGSRITGDGQPDGGVVIPSKGGLKKPGHKGGGKLEPGVDASSRTGDNMPDGVSSDYDQKHETVAKTDKGEKGVSKGSQNMTPSARVSGSRQLAGTKNTTASGKAVKKGGLGRIFSRIFGGAEKVDGGKSGAAQPAGDGQDQPSGGQGQQPKGDKGAPGPKPQGQDDNGGG